MFPYISLLLLFVLFACLSLLKLSKDSNLLLWRISFIVLFLFSGLRYDVGMDYLSYEEMYKYSYPSPNPEIKELGWAYLFYWGRTLNIHFYFVILLVSFLTIKNVFIFISRYSPYPFLSILIFFCFTQYYTYTFNVLRQCLASYLFFTLLVLIKERKMVRYLISVSLISVFIHSTAIMMFPLYFILHKHFSIIIKILIIFAVLLFAKSFVFIIESSETYSIYLKFEEFSEGITITTILLIIITSLYQIYDLFVKERDVMHNIFINIAYCSLVALITACFFENTPLIIVFQRFAYYFTPVLIVLLPITIKDVLKNPLRKIVLLFVVIIYSSLFCYTTSKGGINNKLIPYKTIMSNF